MIIRAPNFADILDKSSLSKIGYEKVVEMLQEVRTLRGPLSLDQTLQLCECELYLQRGMEKLNLNTVRLMCNQNTVQQLEKKANSLKESGRATRALILYTIIDDLVSDKSPTIPDEVVNLVCKRAIIIRRIMKPLLDSFGSHRDIAIKYGLTHIIDLLHKLRAVDEATPTIKVPNEAMCLVQIASINGEVGDTDTSLKVCKEGIKLLEDQFGEGKDKFKCYSWLMYNMGAAYHDSGEHETAIKYTEKSIESNAHASDYDNEAERKEYYEMASRSLAKYRLSS